MPYSVELNDLGMFITSGMTGDAVVQLLRDQLDQLVADAEGSGRVMAVALHPFVIGQAFRARYLDAALEYIVHHPAAWVTTSDEIAEHYAATLR